MRVFISAILLFLMFHGLSDGFADSNSPDYKEAFDDTLNPGELTDTFREIGTVNSLLIQVNGEPVIENYFGQMSSRRTNNIKSASKSILSLLTGIAIEERFLSGTDQTIAEFFPDYFESNPDSVKESITIKDLLTMRTGLETTSFHNYGRWVLNSNWIHFVFNQPLEDRPGGKMIYSTGTTHILSAILTKATGMSTRDFAVRYLFGPMDIQPGGWDRGPQGYYMGGNNMALRPADMLKIGQMVMDMGMYNGKQIVPEEWIVDSFKIYTRSNYNPYDYGYLWWRRKIAGYHIAFAWGNGGQYILLIPELESVIAVTSDNSRGNGSRRYQREMFDWLADYMIPFLKKCYANDK